ncbi:hypothetical protein NRIC_19820 [Enterococcus florum]|uniref:Uncharacterized protein n=1 Tax=Enterococcus florum TaxID=2480627 RepID=A0A4P5PCS4_9ENTE|nr:hypothetical protein [Enterococcus florum]GCF94091.1 hypothetical protein NRIC_19820 [Enterococcus florum]
MKKAAIVLPLLLMLIAGAGYVGYQIYLRQIPEFSELRKVIKGMTVQETERVLGKSQETITDATYIRKRIAEGESFYRSTDSFGSAHTKLIQHYEALEEVMQENPESVSIRKYRYAIKDFVSPVRNNEKIEWVMTYDNYEEIFFVEDKVYLSRFGI